MAPGFSERGTPLGVQLVGPLLSESTLLQAVHLFQQETDFHLRHPSEYL